MKGVELPINILVVVAIAVIVLLGLIALYVINIGPFGGFISLASLKNTGCSNFSFNYECGKRGAATSDIYLPENSYGLSPNTLLKLCQTYFNVSSNPTTGEGQCRAVCGCS
jgi:hypothetical protein